MHSTYTTSVQGVSSTQSTLKADSDMLPKCTPNPNLTLLYLVYITVINHFKYHQILINSYALKVSAKSYRHLPS